MQQITKNRAKSLLTLFFLTFFGSFSFASECDNLKVSSTLSTISISGLTAPIEIVKVYDSNKQIIFECSADCNDDILLSGLDIGDYHVEFQAFDVDWSRLCDTTINVSIEGCFCPAVYMPVCGEDGKTYGNSCEAACAGVAIINEGECDAISTCDLLARITLNPDLCEQCLTEIAVYSLEDKSFLVYFANNITCADGLTRVVDCDTGEDFCLEGGIAGFNQCKDFFDRAEKIETVLEEDCSPCICTQEYAPVCGADGKTYSNRCEADCAGVDIIAEGECSCICPAVALPVCGVDGQTYVNACKAACAGVDVAFEGTCQECIGEPNPLILCTTDYNPVCGCDGNTYSNACQAEAAGIKSWTEGVYPDPDDCIGDPDPTIKCSEELIPVCGCDGNTYQNPCQAQQIGIQKWTEGPCPCVCPEIYAPVCGVDGKTYSNECEAACAGIEIAKDGECTITTCDLLARITLNPDLCGQCLSEIAVYTLDGKSYLVYLGDNTICADVPNVVIDCDTGEEFCNDGGGELMSTCGDFFSKAEKTETILKEDCRPCICTKEYVPVCGTDGKTYGNKCEAACAGVDIISEGECDTNEETCDILNLIDLNPNLCGECLSEIATFSFQGNNYLAFLADNFNCDDALTTVIDCDTGEEFCRDGGEAGFTECEKFFDEAIKIQTILLSECNECKGLPTPGAPCPENYDPVCGCDGETYGNECMAQSNGVKKWTPGECQGLEVIECGEITIAYGSGKIKMTGQDDQNYFFKIHDRNDNWKEVFDCTATCGSEQTAILPYGKYYVKIYNSDWKRVCEQAVTLVDKNAPSEGRFQCEDAIVTYNNGKVILTGATDKSYHLKIIDENYNDVFSCMWECGHIIEATDIPTGHYLVRVLDANYEKLCEEMINLTNDAGDRSFPTVGFSVYPNPAQNDLFIHLMETAKNHGEIQIVNTYGQVIIKRTFDNEENSLLKIDVSAYQNGLYYYQIKLPKQPIVSGKFLVNRLN